MVVTLSGKNKKYIIRQLGDRPIFGETGAPPSFVLSPGNIAIEISEVWPLADRRSGVPRNNSTL